MRLSSPSSRGACDSRSPRSSIDAAGHVRTSSSVVAPTKLCRSLSTVRIESAERTRSGARQRRRHLEPKHFTYEEAANLLPEVIRITRIAIEEATGLLGKPPIEEPVEVDEEKIPELRELLRDWAESMVELGLEVKGLWLVDFDNGDGYYCWRYPEPALEYFHTYEEGFSGRVAIN